MGEEEEEEEGGGGGGDGGSAAEETGEGGSGDREGSDCVVTEGSASGEKQQSQLGSSMRPASPPPPPPPLAEEEGECSGVSGKFQDRRLEAIKASAGSFAQWSLMTQALLLPELVVDAYTCTEVLRLHLAASCGYGEGGDKRWFRHARRGGYTDSDDPVIEMRLEHPHVLDLLAQGCIYDLCPGDKLVVLSTLCNQLLSFSATRDHIDSAKSRSRRAVHQMKMLKFSEERRKKEEARVKKQVIKKTEISLSRSVALKKGLMSNFFQCLNKFNQNLAKIGLDSSHFLS